MVMKWANGWVDFKRSFTQEQEDALWAYFIDHSNSTKNGYKAISFKIKSRDDFWRRVFARHNGDFQRYDTLERETKLNNYAGDRLNKRLAWIEHNGSRWQKFLRWIEIKARKEIYKIDDDVL